MAIFKVRAPIQLWNFTLQMRRMIEMWGIEPCCTIACSRWIYRWPRRWSWEVSQWTAAMEKCISVMPYAQFSIVNLLANGAPWIRWGGYDQSGKITSHRLMWCDPKPFWYFHTTSAQILSLLETNQILNSRYTVSLSASKFYQIANYHNCYNTQ